MTECHPISTPLPTGISLVKSNQGCDEKIPYQQAIGSLMYLAICTRPDLKFAVSYLSQFNKCYNKSHWVALKHVFGYLKGTLNHCLRYDGKETGPEEAQYFHVRPPIGFI